MFTRPGRSIFGRSSVTQKTIHQSDENQNGSSKVPQIGGPIALKLRHAAGNSWEAHGRHGPWAKFSWEWFWMEEIHMVYGPKKNVRQNQWDFLGQWELILGL